jgi:acyl carrier protein
MTDAELYAALTDIFNEVFMRDDIALKPAMTAADIEGWDSFKQIEIIVAAQEHFGVKFASKELDNLACVGDLAGLIAAKAA